MKYGSQLAQRTLTAMISRSDARLFCKNKQVNLKNKPKIGNLTEKQAPYALAAFFSTKRKVNKKIT